MKTFTDNAGNAWTLSLTIDAAKRVKGLLGVNLLELDRPGRIARPRRARTQGRASWKARRTCWRRFGAAWPAWATC